MIFYWIDYEWTPILTSKEIILTSKEIIFDCVFAWI